MSGNSFGKIFRITTFGESHGKAIGVTIDGCPAGLQIDESIIQSELDRRKPGQSNITTQRKEDDLVKIISGVFEGSSTGTPITLIINNKDHKSADYSKLKDVYRPSHADYTYDLKYGIRDYRGGGRASARETAARVAAGAIAKQFLKEYNIDIVAYVYQIGNVKVDTVDFNQIEKNEVRSPDIKAAKNMIQLIEKLKDEGDSVGGIVKCVVKNCPSGLGEPVFDRFEADLAKAMLSINATKGFEIGSGFAAADMHGSQHNDNFVLKNNEIEIETNNAGGVLGGITSGQDIDFKVAFKPTATIWQSRKYIHKETKKEIVLDKKGRHDPCVVPRAVPVVEAMAALVVADFILRNKSVKL
jgi:chorismate synthase